MNSDGNRQDHGELPMALAGHGSGSGSVKTGSHLRVPKETPLNNLFLSMLQRVGVKDERFGDSTGLLTQIDA